jgi:hypothetical protein
VIASSAFVCDRPATYTLAPCLRSAYTFSCHSQGVTFDVSKPIPAYPPVTQATYASASAAHMEAYFACQVGDIIGRPLGFRRPCLGEDVSHAGKQLLHSADPTVQGKKGMRDRISTDRRRAKQVARAKSSPSEAVRSHLLFRTMVCPASTKFPESVSTIDQSRRESS